MAYYETSSAVTTTSFTTSGADSGGGEADQKLDEGEGTFAKEGVDCTALSGEGKGNCCQPEGVTPVFESGYPNINNVDAVSAKLQLKLDGGSEMVLKQFTSGMMYMVVLPRTHAFPSVDEMFRANEFVGTDYHTHEPLPGKGAYVAEHLCVKEVVEYPITGLSAETGYTV